MGIFRGDLAVSGETIVQGGSSTGDTQTLGTTDSFPVDILTAGIVRATFTETGELGIGTDTPAQKVHIENDDAAGNAGIQNNNYRNGGGPGSSLLWYTANGSKATPSALTNNNIIFFLGASGNDDAGQRDFGRSAIRMRAKETWTHAGTLTSGDLSSFPTLSGGETLDVVLNGTNGNITLAAGSDGATVAADIQAKVRAASVPGFAQASFDTFTCTFNGTNLVLTAGDNDFPQVVFGRFVSVETGTGAATLKLDAASGGVRDDGRTGSETTIRCTPNGTMKRDDTVNVTGTSGEGRVGIGTSSPGSKLHVAGTVQADEIVTAQTLIGNFISGFDGGHDGSDVNSSTTTESFDTQPRMFYGVRSDNGAYTLTLSDLHASPGRVIIIVDNGNNAGTNNITVALESGANTWGDGTAGDKTISTNAGVLRLVNFNSQWWEW